MKKIKIFHPYYGLNEYQNTENEINEFISQLEENNIEYKLNYIPNKNDFNVVIEYEVKNENK